MQPGRILFGLLTVSLFVGALGLVSSAVVTGLAPAGDAPAYRLLASYARVVLYLIAGYLWLRHSRVGLKKVMVAGPGHASRWMQVLAVIAGMGVIIGTHFVWTMLLPTRGGITSDRSAVISSFAGAPALLTLQALDYAVITPVCEELFFRRLWLFGMFAMVAAPLVTRKHARIWAAFSIIFTATFFAAIHGEPSRIVPLTVAGIVLGLQAAWSGHIGLSLATHCGVNTIATAALLMQA